MFPGEGAVIETRGALVQGIFGVGGERTGYVEVARCPRPTSHLTADKIGDCQGMVLIAGASVDGETVQRAAAAGATGLVVGAVSDETLRRYVGYDIGVAITGQEDVPDDAGADRGLRRTPHGAAHVGLAGLAGGEGSLHKRCDPDSRGRDSPGDHRDARDSPRKAPRPSRRPKCSNPARVCASSENPTSALLGRVAGLPSELVEIDTESHVRIATVTLDSGRDGQRAAGESGTDTRMRLQFEMQNYQIKKLAYAIPSR